MRKYLKKRKSRKRKARYKKNAKRVLGIAGASKENYAKANYFNRKADRYSFYGSKSVDSAEFGLGRSLVRNKGLIGSATRGGLRTLKTGRQTLKPKTKNLIKNKGIAGQAARLGLKKTKQGIRLGKKLGSSAIRTSQSGIKKIKQSTGFRV